MDKLSSELQNVRLDSSPKVSVHYESDSNTKKLAIHSTASNAAPATSSLTLSQYFGNSQSEHSNFLSDVNVSGTSQVSSKSTSDEPVICRIFAESPAQPQASVDPSTNFFDMIKQPEISMFSANTGVVNELGLHNLDMEDRSGIVLIGNEVDRRRDAWIPTERTRQALIASATSPPGTYFPEREILTMPGVLLEEELNDMLQDVVTHYLGAAEAAQRKVLTANDVTQDERGLRELIQASCYRAAVNLTSRLLTIYGQGVSKLGHPSKHTIHSLQLWLTRIALLIKIKSFVLAEQEAEPFGQLQNPDLFFQFYPDKYGGRPGSIAPFSFRLLLAELPMHCDKPRDAMVKLHAILSIVRQISKNLTSGLSEDGSPMELSDADRRESLNLWRLRHIRIQHSIINCALIQKDYSLAIQVLNQLIQMKDWKLNQQVSLYSALGRVHLQLGDITGAEKRFLQAKQLNDNCEPETRDLVDKSLLAIAQNNFSDAYQLLLQASHMDPSNIMILNNMGVCLLYSGRLKESIALLESAINANPTRGLSDSLLINLCTLYELESSHSDVKKLMLLRQLSRYKADSGMNVQQCLKLAI